MAVETLGSAPRRTRVAPWNDPVIRGWVFQIVVVGLVGLLAWYLVSNTMENLARQKIASGFHYLEREAGFEIGDTMIEYSPASTYARAIWVGILNTLRVAVLGIILSTVLGTLIGVGRLSPNWLLSRICSWYVEAFRNVPLLLWLFLFYKLISEAFPGPRQAISMLWNSVFLSNRGVYFPVPMADPIHKWMGVAFLVGIAELQFGKHGKFEVVNAIGVFGFGTQYSVSIAAAILGIDQFRLDGKDVAEVHTKRKAHHRGYDRAVFNIIAAYIFIFFRNGGERCAGFDTYLSPGSGGAYNTQCDGKKKLFHSDFRFCLSENARLQWRCFGVLGF